MSMQMRFSESWIVIIWRLPKSQKSGVKITWTNTRGFETVLSTDRNLKLLKRAKDAGFFVRCYYVLTADPQINVARVASRVSAGGHGVPTEKIISRYDKALALVHELVPLCDVCHIYDNSLDAPYRIFKKRKEEYWYCPERYLWRKDDITALTGIRNAQRAPLNNHRT